MPFYSIPNGVDAGQINSGTLPDARLSENVVLVDGTGKVPASKLPSYVDDVLEYSSLAAFPAEGEGGKIYVAVDTGRGYRWSGSVYVEVSASPGSTDSVPEGATNLYHTTARAAAAAPVQSVAGKTGVVTLAKGDLGLGNVDNTSDANKPVSTATQTALDGKAAASHSHAGATTSAAGFLSAADKSKLDGIASGATANATDAQLRDRSTHTGTQAVGTVSGLQEALDQKSPRASGASVTITGDWANNTAIPVMVSSPPRGWVAAAVAEQHADGKWIEAFSYNETGLSAGPRITSIVFSDLAGAVDGISLSNCNVLASVSFPELVAAGLQITGGAALASLSAPKLAFAASFSVTAALVTSISLPALRFTGLSFSGTMNSLQSLALPLLESCGGAFSLTSSSLTQLSLPSLKRVAGNVSPNLSAIQALSLPSLQYVNGNIDFTSRANLQNVTLPTDGTLKFIGGNVVFSGNALTQASVENIIKALAMMDGTGGTYVYGTGRTVNISGGTTPAPSDLGSQTTSGSNFVCSGTTCTVNWASHGYATGDVIRVSGITTATNANRYAVITVVNANQFTYSITSQAATGGGTATVRLCNNDVKALVTRGVSLTTN